MGMEAMAAATEAPKRNGNLYPLPPGSTRTAPSRPARHSPLSGNCGLSQLAAGSISGLRDGPCSQERGEGSRGPRGVRYKEVQV